jgi:hypothetical protein
MATKEELLGKMVAGTLSQAEALELWDLLQKEDRETKLKLLTAMGAGAVAALTLPPLLELNLGDLLDLRMEPQAVEMEPEPPAPAGPRLGLRQHPPEYPPPESPEEEALEVAREARTPGQVGAQQMAQPQEMGAPVRKLRAQRR